MGKLTDRQLEILQGLFEALACDLFDDGFVRPMDIGGSDASYHSQVLGQLVRKGLVQRERRQFPYRINQDGIDALKDQANDQ